MIIVTIMIMRSHYLESDVNNDNGSWVNQKYLLHSDGNHGDNLDDPDGEVEPSCNGISLAAKPSLIFSYS